jgi:hypothetical protein
MANAYTVRDIMIEANRIFAHDGRALLRTTARRWIIRISGHTARTLPESVAFCEAPNRIESMQDGGYSVQPSWGPEIPKAGHLQQPKEQIVLYPNNLRQIHP